MAGGIAASHYVTPSMRSLGIPRALAVSGAAPPGGSLSYTVGTAGTWGASGTWWWDPNENTGPKPPAPVWVPDPTGFDQGSPYVGKWDASDDAEWDGIHPQPYAQGDLFNAYFEPSAALDGGTFGSLTDEMIEILAANGNGNSAVLHTARQVIAAYLNASYFGSSYPYAQTEIKNMWRDAILAFEQPANGIPNVAPLDKLQSMLDLANNGNTTKLSWP